MAQDTNFKFGMHAPTDSPDMSLKKFFRTGAWIVSCDLLNFWALHDSSSKMAKDTNFKFGTHAPRERHVMTLKIFSKRAVARVA